MSQAPRSPTGMIRARGLFELGREAFWTARYLFELDREVAPKSSAFDKEFRQELC